MVSVCVYLVNQNRHVTWLLHEVGSLLLPCGRVWGKLGSNGVASCARAVPTQDRVDGSRV